MYLKTFEMCLKIYKLDPPHFLSTPGLAWQAALKKTKVKLDLSTDIDVLFMVEKVSQAEYVTVFIKIWKLIINTWKTMIKIKNRHTLSIGM